jgi:hypothetical protein
MDVLRVFVYFLWLLVAAGLAVDGWIVVRAMGPRPGDHLTLMAVYYVGMGLVPLSALLLLLTYKLGDHLPPWERVISYGLGLMGLLTLYIPKAFFLLR